MTRRGRTTLATLAITALAACLWLSDPFQPVRAAGHPEGASALPAVEAAAPLAHPHGDEAPVQAPGRVPQEILERLPVSRAAFAHAQVVEPPDGGSARLVEEIDRRYPAGPLRVEYTLEAELMEHVFRVLEQGRVKLGHVLLMEPFGGRILAYASTDPERFPPTRTYPAASLVKVITAAAALEQAPQMARLPCRYTGSPYRLTPARVHPPASGETVTLRRALATSNNQCLAQLAVHALGAEPLMRAISRFGWLDSPAPAHAAGRAEAGDAPYELGRLGSGLAGSRITPLHAAQLAASLVHGELVAPRWVERVRDDQDRDLDLPAPPAPRRVLGLQLTEELRDMLVDTTRLGTARRAFRGRGGTPLLGPVAVAGKTGSLSGRQPDGRYEWFMGVAPADSPRVVVVALVVQNELWWRNASQIAAEVLRGVFCDTKGCRPENAERYIRVPAAAAALVRSGATSVSGLN